MRDLEILNEIEVHFNIVLNEVNPLEWNILSNSFRKDSNDNIIFIQINDYDFSKSSFKELIQYLSKFSNLKDLNLHNNGLIDIKPIKALNKLVYLNLSSNKLKNIDTLIQLKNLVNLNIANNPEIENYHKINNLQNLKTLNISSNKFLKAESFSINNSIETLIVDNCEILDPSFIQNFKKIKELSLTTNKIQDISLLCEFSNIEKLDLSHNKISDISQLKKLKKLVSLSLIDNQITDISSLKNLPNLERINLAGNKIQHIAPLSNLKNLKTLWLVNNELRDFEKISQLINLEALSLGSNNIENINFLKDLTKIETLHLQDNNINDISCLENLVNIESIHLENNNISNINVIQNFTKANNILLQNNPITQLPSWITKLELDIKWIDFDYNNNSIVFFNNPIKSPPIEILKQGNTSIKRYFERIGEEGEDFIYEVKLTLVGEGNSGKTSLQKRLLNKRASLPKKDTRTRGIEIKDWKFKKQKTNIHIAHIWDFGGQDVYYPVHRFFITENSVFILLASTRQTHHNFDYWIPTIYQFGGKSPIILAQTCHDGNKISWNDLGTFISDTNFNIIKTQQLPYYEVNLPNSNEGLEKLENAIINQIVNLPHYGKGVPKSWVPIRYILEEESKKKACISFERYAEICKNSNSESFSNITDIEDCCQFLHDIGVLLWYSNNEDLKNWVILQPEWAMNAVYKIIDDEEIQNKRGNINSKDFKRLWENKYFEGKHIVLKKMLEIFKIAFPKKHKREDYIMPARLISMPNERKWKEADKCLSLEYKYQFMPRGLVNHLSAELSRYIININEVWNNAVNFYMENDIAQCQVIEDFYNRKIIIRAKGQDARSLIILVMDALNNITEDFRGVKPQIFVPCNCENCENNSAPTTFLYDKLTEWSLKRPNATVVCNESGDNITIDKLLYNVGLSTPKKIFTRMNKTIRIFLASSSELKKDREAFEIFINRENKRLNEEGIFLRLELWEDFIDSMSRTRLQDEYNKVVRSSDIFVSLYFKKVGKYTAEEFENAYNQFKKSDKPKIYTYFKTTDINIDDIEEKDILSKFEFENKIKSLGHFPTKYKTIDELKLHFKKQLDDIIPSILD